MSQPRRQMLPAELLGRPGARRSARDWLVDLTLWMLAAGGGIFVAGTTAHAHTDGLWVLDLAGGVAAAVSFWWRRTHPVRVAVIAIGAGAFSAFGSGFAIVALFNLAIRGSRRAIVWGSAATLASSVAFGLVYPDPATSLGLEITLGVVFTVLPVGWGL